MSEHQHNLANEFPEYKDLIHELKISNRHFHKLFEEYQEVNGAISRSENRLDVISEIEEENLRKQRLKLKDEIFVMLKANSK